MNIDVLLGGERVPIEREVFELLLINSVASRRVAYAHGVERREIAFHDLVDVSRAARIPYSLFFAPLPFVQAQVGLKTEKLLAGLTKESFSLNVRESVRLRDIELILRDLIRKQRLLTEKDRSLGRNRLVGLLSRRGESVEVDAQRFSDTLRLDMDHIRSARTKDVATERLIRCLEDNQVLVSQSQNHFMPQRLAGVSFSGMTVKDSKVPYIFLPSGDEGEQVTTAGRRNFSLMLLAVLVARGIFAPVNYDSTAAATNNEYEYDLTAELLMPQASFPRRFEEGRVEFEVLADDYKVTPSAVIVRAMRLGRLDSRSASRYLADLRVEFKKIPKRRGGPSKPVNAVRKYNGRELSLRMLRALDDRRLTERDFYRVVCLDHLGPNDLEEFRKGLK